MTCRLCSGVTVKVLSLTPTPLANSFPRAPYAGEKYPLDLERCDSCGHVQLGCIVPDALLYGSEYKYQTPIAQAPDMAKRAWALKIRYPKAKRVLEIGSNNEMLLQQLRLAGFESTLGADPCDGTAFDSNTEHRDIDLIVANNVFAHVEDLNDIFIGIDRCLTDTGALVFEVQYFVDMAEKGLFDMIYHEHRDYHTLLPLVPFLARHHLAIKEVEHIPNHGGSIRVHCGRGDGIPIIERDVDFGAFADKIAAHKYRCIRACEEADMQIIAFGATAKACTLIHHFGLQKYLSYCVDSTPEKEGRYIPGTNIRVLDERILRQSKSEKTLLLTAWNYEQFVRAKYPDLDFIVPFNVPERRLAA